jgi:broad specificity phosphatase PhoE
MRMRRTTLVALATLVAAPTPSALQAQSVEEATVVYVVRHAERADGSEDSQLSAAGEQRAQLLAELLRDARITHIHTTDFRRTRATAAPIAQATGLTPSLYDDDLGALAARVRAQPGRHLVVGHSNTIPVIASALGGERGELVAQEEYDRLYILTLTERGTSTVMLRFGAPYRPPPP